MVCLTIGKGFPVDVIYSLSNRWERLPRGRHNYVFFLTDGKDFPVDVICNLSNRWERLSPWTLYAAKRGGKRLKAFVLSRPRRVPLSFPCVLL